MIARVFQALGMALAALLFFASRVALGAPTPVPEPLKPWQAWALAGHEHDICPNLHGTDEQRCAWPSRLSLAIEEKGGTFTQAWHIEGAPVWVPLPGDDKRWPLEVKVDGKRAVVTAQQNLPSVELTPGDHTISGTFAWDSPPESLQVPPETGLLALTLRGAAIASPNRSASGTVYLQKTTHEEEGEKLELVVHRRVTDDVPLVMTTRIELNVAGKSREVLLGKALPAGFTPMSLDSALPARVEPDSRLRVQVRPGTFLLTLVARGDGALHELSRPKPEGPWREGDEVWVFDARPDARVVVVEGVSAIDPQQTTLPEDWKRLPAYPMKLGDVMRLNERRRGDADPPPNQLTLSREMWLDFEGTGYTVTDTLRGALNQGARLEMAKPTSLGRVAIGGHDQFITHLLDKDVQGVEVRQGTVYVTADSRIEGNVSDVPAVGWKHDFHQVSGTLHLPPGWRLVHASGVDEVPGTWIGHWSLFELFLALVTAAAIARLYGLKWGALALVMLALTFPEGGAPKWAWICVVAAEALVRVLPADVPKRIARAARFAAITGLVLTSIPFLAKHVREGMFPVLERGASVQTEENLEGQMNLMVSGHAVRADGDVAMDRKRALQEAAEFGMIGLADQAAAGDTTNEPMDVTKSSGQKLVVHKPPAQGWAGKDSSRTQLNAETYDPNAVVQTGPGLPRWSWTSVDLKWSGPVESSQRLKLFLLSPAMNLALAIFRALLVVILVLRLLPWVDRLLPPGFRLKVPATAAAAAALLVLFVPGRAFAQSYPPKELLDDLRDRMTQSPSCLPTCASANRMLVEARGETLRARIELDAAAQTAVPLPGGADQWVPERVLVDGQPAKALLRKDGALFVEVGPGAHQLLLEGAMPERESVQLALPLKPHRVEARAQGWTVEGVHEDGLADDNLQFTRNAREGGGANAGLQPGVLPPFVRVERTLRLGLNWQVETRVARVTPVGSAVVLEVPLLPGESVTTADVRVVAGKALVNMGPSQTEVAWHSVLEQKSPLPLVAPKNASWAEVWTLDLGPIWHAEPKGIPVVHTAKGTGVHMPEWHPWPGEEVLLHVSRPDGVAGQSLTIDKALYDVVPGLRATDATLTLTVRASRGLQHTVTLPEGATLESVQLNGAAQPIRQDGRKVTFPIAPGVQTVRIGWREPRAVGLFFQTPEVDLGASAVNVTTTISGQADRWILLLGGPRLGPAVLFWGLLLVLLVVAAALARIRWTPLKTWQWMLLAIGLSQVPMVDAAVVALWLVALGWRKERVEIRGGPIVFDLRQIALAAWTCVALLILVGAVHKGLLGAPDMQISGNGASPGSLSWYVDRSASALTRPWIVSAPLLVYRTATLLWALWLALAVIKWLRWGWSAFTTGGAWRALPKPPPRPAAPPPAAPPDAPPQDPAAPASAPS